MKLPSAGMVEHGGVTQELGGRQMKVETGGGQSTSDQRTCERIFRHRILFGEIARSIAKLVRLLLMVCGRRRHPNTNNLLEETNIS
jgi:hypothetical protein